MCIRDRGSAWFVKGIQVEKNAAAVMKSLSNFNPKDTAIVEEKDQIADLNNLQFDSTASISLVENKNDEVLYKSNSSKKQFAVFSEVYYRLGWKAFVDDKETPIVKANYVLRGIVVNPGKHNIRFEFTPSSISTAKKASSIASFLMWGLLIGLAVFTIKNSPLIKASK